MSQPLDLSGQRCAKLVKPGQVLTVSGRSKKLLCVRFRAGKQKMHDDTAAEKKYGIEYAH